MGTGSLLALAVLLASVIGSCAPRAEPDQPAEAGPGELSAAASGWNVLLLSADTLRADRLGAYGYEAVETSPRLDGFLASGVRFGSAHAQRALTWPSLASVLTGLYPGSHGVLENGWEIPDEVPTLAELLGGAGYRTAAFLSNMCRANHRGWESFACGGGRDGKTVSAAEEWLAQASGQAGGEDPFFLWVHLFGAHGPYYNGGDLAATTLDPGYEGEIGSKKWRLDRVMTEGLELDAADRRHLDALYDAAVVGTDRLAGRVLDALAASGRGERTLVVFLSDHGEELYQHNGYLYHACSVYQSTLHVPLGFAAPGLIPGDGTVAQSVELIDVLPTLLDLLGIEAPPGIQGRSLTPYLERPGRGGAGKAAFSEYGTVPLRTVVEGRWKLIHNPTGHQPYCLAGAPEGHYPLAEAELYDLESDPLEEIDLASAHPARVAELGRLIELRFSSLRRRDAPQEIPEELVEELEALGYVAR